MIIDPKKQSFNDNYKLMIGSILPRPIAFVSTRSSEGVLNLAPFSFFTGITGSRSGDSSRDGLFGFDASSRMGDRGEGTS